MQSSLDILIVDDDAIDRELLRRTLGPLDNIVIHMAETGSDALQVIDNQNIKLVITDIFMPSIDGLEFITKIQVSNPEIRVVAVSGKVNTRGIDYLKVAESFGACATFKKEQIGTDLLPVTEGLLIEL